MSLSTKDQERLRVQLGRAFSPAAPINQYDLFAGRSEQLSNVIGAINQRGQHAIIFGERGVGKTSLANVLSSYLESVGAGMDLLAPKVNCDSTDNFSSIWRKVFSKISLVGEVRGVGFLPQTSEQTTTLADRLPKVVTPDVVRDLLEIVGAKVLPIVIIDEFDRLRDRKVGGLFADTIKTLSDYSSPATVVLVGVADSVGELIREHQSVERALVQVRMPRMSREELHEIVRKGLSVVDMSTDPEALDYMARLSQGLPHFMHLVGLFAAYKAVNAGDVLIRIEHVEEAIASAIEQAQQSIREAHHRATMSPRKENLYAQVLLACALAKTDDLGYFAAADVRDPMSRIMKKRYEIPAFSRHLNDFCENTRGPILQKIGTRRRFRFRFLNPLMQPFVIMHGLSSGLVDRQLLEVAV